MDFQIKSLPAETYEDLFDLSNEDLAALRAKRMIVDANPGTPCRVSMTDAKVGETVILLNHSHLSVNSPFASTHAIFVRQGAAEAHFAINEVPDVLQTRLISLRCFDQNHMMIEADVVPGGKLVAPLALAFDNPNVAYVHLHYAKPGCFAASAKRVGEK